MSKKKIALAVCGVLVLLLIMAGNSTPKTVGQFVSNYNRLLTLGKKAPAKAY